MKHMHCACQHNAVAPDISTPLVWSVEHQAINLVVVGLIPTWGINEGTKELKPHS